jgi:hypothetical protein
MKIFVIIIQAATSAKPLAVICQELLETHTILGKVNKPLIIFASICPLLLLLLSLQLPTQSLPIESAQ